MHVYFSGLGGVAIGPLALICRDAGFTVSGSDIQESRWTHLIETEGIHVAIGQDGSQIAAAHATQPIDWLVISSAVPQSHLEVQFAKAHGIKVTKRDEILNLILQEKHLKLIAISGTHGKTTTTAMMVWLFMQFNKKVSYSIGSHMNFAPSGAYQEGSDFFVYECDEYDRNLLAFHPYLALLTTVDYDHPDTYPTRDDYDNAFRQFTQQSEKVIAWRSDASRLHLTHSRLAVIDDNDEHIGRIQLLGSHYRKNAWETVQAFCQLFPEVNIESAIAAINRFPGTDRRLEKIAENIYSTYAHHPAEIAADLQMAFELNKPVIAVYQPHQNIRQHEMLDEYKDSFAGATKVYWLPTYLSREDPNLAVLTPEEIIGHLTDPSIAEPAEMDDELAAKLQQAASTDHVVVCMGAGSIDEWIRHLFAK